MENNHTGLFTRKNITKKDYQVLKEIVLSGFDEDALKKMLETGFCLEEIIPILFHETSELFIVNQQGILNAYRFENELLGTLEHHDLGIEDYIEQNSQLWNKTEPFSMEDLIEDYNHFILRSFINPYYLEFYYFLYFPEHMRLEQQQMVETILARFRSQFDQLIEANKVVKHYHRPLYLEPAYLKTTAPKNRIR